MSLEADDLARFPTLARLVLGLVAKKGKYEYCYLFSSSDLAPKWGCGRFLGPRLGVSMEWEG